MRKFAPRPDVSDVVQVRLANKVAEIMALADIAERKARARTVFDSTRAAQWFVPVLDALRGLCGAGQLCMYCSSNEPSQVEHFKPLALFPELALVYQNYLWSCDICNRTYKGDWFPPLNCAGAPLINPLDENVWDHFFIDHQFGRLSKRLDLATGQFDARAESTCKYVGIDREVVQIKRARRYKNLLRDVNAALAQHQNGALNIDALKVELEEMRSEPFQSDVADFFLSGPGRVKVPFRDLLLAVGEQLP